MPENHTIELWEIEKLVPYEANAKKHPEDQIRKLAQAIKKFGWTQPIVIWGNGEIIAGHGRRLAALSLGLKKVPVIVRSDLSKAEADALRLADNKVASTDYDQAAIQLELQRLSAALEESDIDLSDLGFDDKELEFSLSDLGVINDDFFVDDIGGAVQTQQEENRNAIKTTDDTAAPIGDALGFKRVTVEESRFLRHSMTSIEAQTGQQGVSALIAFIKTNLASAA